MIKPTVGRVVWYRPSVTDMYSYPSGFGGPQPNAAIIAYVHSDSMVNLMVIDHNGNQHSRTSVPLIQDDVGEVNPVGGGSYCEWMPYQKGQAAKTDSLEQRFAALDKEEVR